MKISNDKIIKAKEELVNKTQSEIDIFNENKKNIQSQFSFEIPDYLIDDIVDKNFDSLYCLINCAIVNGHLSKENAKKLKSVYRKTDRLA